MRLAAEKRGEIFDDDATEEEEEKEDARRGKKGRHYNLV